MAWHRIVAAVIPSVAAVFLAAATAEAQLPAARLYALFPPGGQQGSQFDATIEAGEDLDDVSALHFSQPGITAEPIVTEPTEVAKTPEPARGKFRIAIAAHVPPGFYDVRAIGKYGISCPRAFVVGDRPEVMEREPNDTLDKAQPIELNSVVNGVADSEGRDCYAFHAAKGQRILIECPAAAIDSQIIPAIELYDNQGHELARARQSAPEGPLIDFTAPGDGTYLIRLYDLLYRGGANYFYRLSAHTQLHIDFVMPPAATEGSSKFIVYGRNLPGGAPVEGITIDGRPIERLAVDIELSAKLGGERTLVGTIVRPEGMALDGMDYQLHTPQGLSNSVFVGLATAPPVLEKEPHNSPQTAQRLNVPCEVAGQFWPADDVDWFQFEAKQGDVFYLDVISQRLGLSTDPVLVVERIDADEQGKEKITPIVEADDSEVESGGRFFAAKSEDPMTRLDVTTDGTYRISVRDRNGVSGGDPRAIYRLSIRRPQPDFRLAATPMYPPNEDQKPTPWTTHVRPGGVEILRIIAFRQDGFDGQIEVRAEGFPAGVTCRPAFIGPDSNTTDLVFQADEKAPDWSGTIRVVGRAKVAHGSEDVELVREARGASLLWPARRNDDFLLAETRMTREIALSVGGEAAPLLVVPAEDKTWEAAPGGTLQITLRLIRRATIQGEVVLRPSQRTRGPLRIDELKFSSGSDEAVAKIKIPADAKAGTYTIGLQAVTPLFSSPELKTAAANSKKNEKLTFPGTSLTFSVVPGKEKSAGGGQ